MKSTILIWRYSLVFCIALAWLPGQAQTTNSLLASTGAAPLKPRPVAVKPAQTHLEAYHENRFITVKFRDGLRIRAREGGLIDGAGNELIPGRDLPASLAGGTWRRVDRLPEEQVEQMRQTAQHNLGCEIADLNMQFYLTLPPGEGAAAASDALNALDIVELAQPVQRLAPLPNPPDLVPSQGYLLAGSSGVNAPSVWQNYCVRGAGVKVVAVECSYNPTHIDLPGVTVLGGDISVFGSPSFEFHGTATLGVMSGLDNAYGITGISPDSAYYLSCPGFFDQDYFPFYDPAAAILTAAAGLSAGDVMLIELQGYGPSAAYVPIEWDVVVYARIVTAVGLGIVVVEPAGNGNQDLDNPIYSTGNAGHWPFLPNNDSGAIMVGAGAAPVAFGGSDTERSRLSLSNYGGTVDVQGWGEAVITSVAPGNTTYGTYTGTSSAGSIVAGVCALVQSVYKASTATVLTPAQMKLVLSNTGTAQQTGINPISQKIGPLPNALAALATLVPAKLQIAPPAPPTLMVIVITWTGPGVLQYSADLGPNADWISLPSVGNTYSLDLATVAPESRGFFRVRLDR